MYKVSMKLRIMAFLDKKLFQIWLWLFAKHFIKFGYNPNPLLDENNPNYSMYELFRLYRNGKHPRDCALSIASQLSLANANATVEGENNV